MSEAINTFEAQLKNKLLFKSSSKISPEAVLFKAFKFFDTFNNGYLNRKDFFKAIVKCGVIVDTYDLDIIYGHYDVDKSGKIYYKQFIQNFFQSDFQSSEDMSGSSFYSRKTQSKQSKFQPHDQISNDQKSSSSRMKASKFDSPSNKLLPYEEIIHWVQRQMKAEGISGLLNFANVLKKSTDESRTHLISGDKLKKCLNFLSVQNVQTLMGNFSPNKYEEINYAQLIYSLKGNMSERRQRIVDDLFENLDVKKESEIEIAKLVNNYKYKSQLSTFKNAVAAYEKFQSIDDGIFTDEDFNDFFQFISFSFNDDASFEEFIRVGFYGEELARSVTSSRSSRQREFGNKKESLKPNEQISADFRKVKEHESSPISQIDDEPKQKFQKSHYHDEEKRSVASRRSERSERKQVQPSELKEVEMILLRMKKRLGSKGTKGFLAFEKSLKHYDTDEDGFVNLDQFKAVVKDQKIDITITQAINIFNIFNHEGSGYSNYQEIVQTLKGEQIPARKQIFQKLWDKVKIDNEFTSFAKIKGCLNFRNHPDIQTGRRYDDQIFGEIKDTIMMIQDLEGSPRSDVVSHAVFDEYCQNLSLSIPENQLFQSVVNNFWKIQSTNRIEDQYAGSRKLFDPSYKGYLVDHHRYAIKGGSVTDNAPFGTFHGPTNYTTEHQRL